MKKKNQTSSKKNQRKNVVSKKKTTSFQKERFLKDKNTGLFIGRLQIHASGSAHLLAQHQGEADLFIAANNTGTALQGDLVAARLVRPRFPSHRFHRAYPEGEVVKVLERSQAPIVGTFHRNKNFSTVSADDPRFLHHFLIVGETLGAQSGEKVVIVLESWKHRSDQPKAKMIEVLGRASLPEVAILALIRKHQLPTAFPEPALKEAALYGSKLSPKDLVGREDLRKRSVITIDPPDARDFDDAIEVNATKEGWDVSIHIADVAHYVLPKTALDQEAQHRGNSVYLVDRVLPMLPESLSNGLCSLKPHEDRLAFSVFVSIDKKGKPHHVRFARTVIRSSARLTYPQALELLQHPPKNPLAQHVHTAWKCASLLRQRRFEHGALNLDMPEIKVILDKQGVPLKLERIENDISHQLIEEFMLLANELVARHLTHRKQATLYRAHEKPDPEKLKEYRELVISYGMKVGDLTHRQELQRFLNELQGKAFENALKIGLLRSLKRAHYTPEVLGHYGLQKKDYLHFTSPIRRYADLVAHRSLARELGLTKSGPASHDLHKLGDHISNTERTASEAERESIRLKKLDYLEAQQHPKKKRPFKAQVIEANSYGLFVELPDLLISGLVPVASMKEDIYFFDARRARLVGKRTKRSYRAGDILQVVVEKVDRWKQQVDFCLYQHAGGRDRLKAESGRR